MSTAPNVHSTRKFLASLIKQHRTFQLRVPGAGLLIQTNYQFCQHTLPVGAIVGIASDTWLEIGYITKDRYCKESGRFLYHINTIGRLVDEGGSPGFNIPANRVSCVFNVVVD